MALLPLKIDGTRFRDSKGREVTIRGINAAADAKFPRKPDQPSHIKEKFFDGDNVSFVGRPFSKEEGHEHFGRLKRWGYNTIRYIFTWEAIEHEGPGKYDEAWIEHTIEILRMAKEYSFYVFMDPHQDVWSRFSGGSGAPLWTLYACGLNPETFAKTQAAIVHNTYPDPANYPKMIWSTNYTRLANQTLWTLFYGGKDYAPNAIIDGKNIQDYLTEHYVGACRHLAQRIHEAGDLENDCVIGWESLNEPNRGLISWADMTVIPPEQKLQKGTSPTVWQAILTGSGRAVEIDTYEFGSFGPYKSGRELVDPQGTSAWLPADYADGKYGWKRDPGWKLGECLWAQNGVWDPKTDKLLKKDYFSKNPKTGKKLDYEGFTNDYFMQHYRIFRDGIRSVHKDCMMFCQAPVMEIPPNVKGTSDDDPNMVFASHYYDGLTLLTKHWNRLYNVDVFGVLRGRYLTPAFALKIGEVAIRNCLRDQLEAIRQEGLKHMGEHPCVFTEIGIPYDMDDKYAYKTGDYTSQSLAMDANHYALEGSGASGYTLWTYTANNNHEWGDLWNGEDLSIYSAEDHPLPQFPQQPSASAAASSLSLPPNTTSDDVRSPSFSASRSNSKSPTPVVEPDSLPSALQTPAIRASIAANVSPPDIAANPGFRAAEAYVRPAPICTHGSVKSYGFDLRNCVFSFELTAASATPEDAPTEIFLPEYHFGQQETRVEVSGGKWSIEHEDVQDGINVQKLKWWHAEGEQTMKVYGVKRRQGISMGKDDEEDLGYLEQCRQSTCTVM